MAYSVLEANSATELEDKVETFLAMGWILSGGVSVTVNYSGTYTFYQAVNLPLTTDSKVEAEK